MKIERLRKSHKKEIIIGGLITICLISAIAFVGTRAKYKTTERLEHVITGTIKYTPYDFKIMAMYKSEDGTNYTEITDRMPSSGYVINEEKSYCTIDNKTHDTEAVLKTIDGNHVISNLTKSDKCYLYFDIRPVRNITELIAAENPKKTTPDFSQAATTDEGIYAVEDGMYGGTSYYWRGAVTNNYVKFGGFCWRIVRINGDGTMRLIYDGATCHANGTETTESLVQPTSGTIGYAYNTSYDRSNYVGWTYSGTSQRTTGGTSSNAKTQIESWYNANVKGTNALKVVQGKYCNDRNASSEYTWAIAPSKDFYYAANKRTITDFAPTLNCPTGDVYTLNVGLITADEAMYAGGKGTGRDINNTSYYLYNGENYWTMSPNYWYASYNRACVFAVKKNGLLSHGDVYENYVGNTYGLRPVINLHSDVTFSSGTGTQSNPYVVQ